MASTQPLSLQRGATQFRPPKQQVQMVMVCRTDLTLPGSTRRMERAIQRNEKTLIRGDPLEDGSRGGVRPDLVVLV